MYMIAGSIPRFNEHDYGYIIKVAIVRMHVHNLYTHWKDGTLKKFLDDDLNLSNLG